MPTHPHRKGGVADLVAHANQALTPNVMISQIQQSLNADVQLSHPSSTRRRRKLHKKKSKRSQQSSTRHQKTRVKS